MADQTLHMFEGWVIFLACAALLFAEMYLLSFISGEPFWGAFRLAGRPARIPSEQRGILHARPLVASLALICIGTIVVFRISDRAEVIPQRTSFVEFPVRVGPWQGRRSELDADTLKVLRLDDYILSDYVQSEGDAVNLYIAYYASQRTGESPHSPIVCIPGGGWTITNLQQISYAAPKGRIPINRAVIGKGADKELVYYWFDERGRAVASEFWAKFYLLFDAIVRNRTDGALIRLTTPIKPDEPQGDADRRLQSFMRSALPRLKPFLPDRPVAGPIFASWQHSPRL